MSGFSNRAEDAAVPSRDELRASIDRTLADLAALDPMRAWGADQKVPVPVHVFELLEGIEYEQFERDLAQHLEELSR